MPNDFLSHLSAKALEHAEVDAPGSGLQPRLASRFESNAPAGLSVDQAPDQQSLSEIDGNVDTDLRNSAAPSDEAPVGRSHSAPRQGLVAHEYRRNEPKHYLENQGTLTVPDPLKPMSATEHFDSFHKPFTPAPAQQTELPRLVRKDANPSPRTEVQEVIERHTTIIQTSSTDPKQLTPAPVPLLPSSQAKVVPERIEVTRVERQPQASQKESQIVPSVELPAFKPQSRASETQEKPPTIHVTIGRIEVKAAPPAAAPKRRASAPPTMSLDEYLSRRSGGER